MSYDVNPSVEGKTLLFLIEDSMILGQDNPLFCSTNIDESPFNSLSPDYKIWSLQNDKILEAFYYYEVVMNSEKDDLKLPNMSRRKANQMLKNWEKSTLFQLRLRAKILINILSYFTRSWRENERIESDIFILPADNFDKLSNINSSRTFSETFSYVLDSDGMKINADKVIKVLADLLPLETIDESSAMENTPSWDSLTHMNLMIGLTESFLVDFSPLDIAEATSIKSIVDLLNR